MSSITCTWEGRWCRRRWWLSPLPWRSTAAKWSTVVHRDPEWWGTRLTKQAKLTFWAISNFGSPTHPLGLVGYFAIEQIKFSELVQSDVPPWHHPSWCRTLDKGILHNLSSCGSHCDCVFPSSRWSLCKPLPTLLLLNEDKCFESKEESLTNTSIKTTYMVYCYADVEATCTVLALIRCRKHYLLLINLLTFSHLTDPSDCHHSGAKFDINSCEHLQYVKHYF